MTLNLGWNRFMNCLKGLNKVFRSLIVFCLFTVVSLAETQINPLGKQTGTTYDPAGNRLRTNAQATDNTVASGNRITAAAVNTYAYDDYGNMVQKSRIQDPSDKWIYSYDHRNRLTLAIHYSGVSVLTTVSYTYDALNRRVAKAVNPAGSSLQIRYYFYAGEQLLAEKAPGGGVIHYLSGSGLDNWLARQPAGQGVEWFLKDRLGSVKSIINNQGNILESYEYSVFGSRSINSSPNPLITPNSIGFTGREYDQETGLYYYRARYYEPSLGKFLSNDPLGFDAGDYNLSRYVMNDPLSFVDPTGMVSSSEYASFQSRVVLAVQECIKQLGIGIVENAATAGVYLFLAETKVYAGRSINPSRREKQHVAKGVNMVKNSFKVFEVNADVYRKQLLKVRQLEQYLINLITKDDIVMKSIRNKRNEIKGEKTPCGAI